MIAVANTILTTILTARIAIAAPPKKAGISIAPARCMEINKRNCTVTFVSFARYLDALLLTLNLHRNPRTPACASSSRTLVPSATSTR